MNSTIIWTHYPLVTLAVGPSVQPSVLPPVGMNSIELTERKRICVEASESKYDGEPRTVQPKMEVCRLKVLFRDSHPDQML